MIVPYSGCLYRLLVEVAIIAAIAIGVMIWQANRKRPVENVVPTNPKSAILQRIQLTGELVTSVAVVQVIVRNSEAREWLRLKVGTAEMLLVALGEVRAGVDLAALDETALAVEGDKITVTLPACKVLDAKLDAGQTYVYNLKKSFLLPPDGVNLQSAGERQAIEEIERTAIQAGLLDQANKQARTLIQCFLSAAGFRTVEFQAKGDA
ncbi:MAG TPA: DUF4230 domain-containing protein [Candidatus Hydrogenedentes bacterium]|nr:DUF4230 domain-containing protein [Candidatus Hydrogenedentota bacterium]